MLAKNRAAASPSLLLLLGIDWCCARSLSGTTPDRPAVPKKSKHFQRCFVVSPFHPHTQQMSTIVSPPVAALALCSGRCASDKKNRIFFCFFLCFFLRVTDRCAVRRRCRRGGVPLLHSPCAQRPACSHWCTLPRRRRKQKLFFFRHHFFLRRPRGRGLTDERRSLSRRWRV